MITITVSQLIIELISTILIVGFTFLMVWGIILKDQLKIARNALDTQTLITSKWKAFYNDFYNKDHLKLLGQKVTLLQENIKLKQQLHLTGVQVAKNKKDLNQALNEMNNHSDKKVLDCLEDEFRKELKKNTRKN
jgi:hypothetical protein